MASSKRDPGVPWRIELLGGLRVIREDQVITRFRSQKYGLLLAYLALHPQHPQPREVLIELLWPEIDPEVGRTNFRTALHSLRRELEGPATASGAAAGLLFLTDRQSVRLDPAAFRTDVGELREAAEAAGRAAAPGERAAGLARAAALYRGEFLPGSFEPWVLEERQQLAEVYLAVLQQWTAALEQAGDLPGALEAARRAVHADPLREEAHYELMRLYAAAGQPSATVKQYQELERLLREELGETPSAATRALADELRESARTVVVARSLAAPRRAARRGPGDARLPDATGQDPSLGPPAPSPAPSVSPPSTPGMATRPAAPRLPPQFTRFFGREEEIARLTELLRIPETRLVTLTGPGGSGKTRLAVAVAGRVQEQFEARVWFVPLAEVQEAGRLGEALREALDLPPEPSADALQQVIAALRERPALLVLDNFEQLAAEGATLVHALLARLPALTCLVTSRERLELAGEQEFIVLPLPAPSVQAFRRSGVQGCDPEGLSARSPKAQAGRLNSLLGYPSVALFVDRAQAARPGFQLTQENAPAVVQLCDRLEGLPLAIELAAARASVLTPQQMLPLLSQRFALLVSEQRDRSARHRTLQAAIEWSYQQLPPELQRFFDRLSIFRGGCTLEAAEAVCVDFGLYAQSAISGQQSALAFLDRLRKCSLVIVEEAGAEMRYRLLETLREYGAAHLTPGEQQELARRHAEHFTQLAERAEAERTREEQSAWSERLAREHENLRAALTWGLGSGVQAFRRSGVQADADASVHGVPSPGPERLNARTPERRNAAEMGVRLAAALWWYWPYQGRLREGREWLEQVRPHAGSAPPGARGRLLLGEGRLLLLQGDFKAAEACCDASLGLFQEVGDAVGTAHALYHLGWTAHGQKDLARARALWEQSLARWRQLGCEAQMAQLLRNLKWLVADLGDQTAARACYEEELALMQAFGGAAAAAAQLIREVDEAAEQGNHSALRWICAEALALWRQFGSNLDIAHSLDYLGVIARDLGEYELARALREQSVAIVRALALENNIHLGLWNLAQIARLMGDLTAARVWAEESLRIARELDSKEPIAHALDELRLIAWKQGDWHAADSQRQSLALWVELGNDWGLAEALEGVAHVAVARGEAERAARLFGAADRLRETIGRSRHPHERADYERSLAAARAALGEAAFSAAWEKGRELAPREAAAEAQWP